MARDWEDVAAEIAAKRIEDKEARVCAMLGVCEDCAGLPADHLTPRKMLLLEYAANAFVGGGEVMPEDVVQFLWVISPDYSPDSEKAKAFSKKVGGLKYETAVASIRRWLELQLLDVPPAKPSGRISGRLWLAQYVDLVAHQYGWTDEHIMNLPLGRLGQYKNEIVGRENGTGGREPHSAYEDRMKAEWLREKQAEKSNGKS